MIENHWKPTNHCICLTNQGSKKSSVILLFAEICGFENERHLNWCTVFIFRHQIKWALHFPIICPPFSYLIKQAIIAIAKKCSCVVPLIFFFCYFISNAKIEVNGISGPQQCPWLLLTTICVCNHPAIQRSHLRSKHDQAKTQRNIVTCLDNSFGNLA